MNHSREMSVSQEPSVHEEVPGFKLTCPLLPLGHAVRSGLWTQQVTRPLCSWGSRGYGVGAESLLLLHLAHCSGLRLGTVPELLVTWRLPSFIVHFTQRELITELQIFLFSSWHVDTIWDSFAVITFSGSLPNNTGSLLKNRVQEGPLVAPRLWTRLGSKRMWVWSPALLSGVRIWLCWELWCRSAAAAPIRPRAWELPYATGAVLKKQNKQTKKVEWKKESKQRKPRTECLLTWAYLKVLC